MKCCSTAGKILAACMHSVAASMAWSFPEHDLHRNHNLPHDIEPNIPQQLKLQLENDSFYIQRRNMASHSIQATALTTCDMLSHTLCLGQ